MSQVRVSWFCLSVAVVCYCISYLFIVHRLEHKSDRCFSHLNSFTFNFVGNFDRFIRAIFCLGQRANIYVICHLAATYYTILCSSINYILLWTFINYIILCSFINYIILCSSINYIILCTFLIPFIRIY